MSMREFSLARFAGPPMSAAARLTLLSLADSCGDGGEARGTPTIAAEWCDITTVEAALGWDELVSLGLIYADDLLPPGYVWLTCVAGWVQAWEATARVKYPTVRPPMPKWLRDEVLERDGFRCVMCGATDNLQVDHRHPVSRGGLTIAGNLQVLCQSHNASKSDHLAEVAA